MKLNNLNFLAIALLISLQQGVAAEKQTVTIAAPLVQIEGLPKKLPLSEKDARQVVARVLKANSPTGGAVMLHAVTYLDDKPAADRQDWYTVDLTTTPKLQKIEAAGDFHAADQYKRQRIFGASKLGVVYLHILQAAARSKIDEQLHGADFSRIQTNLQSAKDDERNSRCPPAKALAACLSDVTRDTDALIKALTDPTVTDNGSAYLTTLNKKVSELKSTRASVTTLDQAALDQMLAVFQSATVETAIQGLLTSGSFGQITLVAKGGNLTGRGIPIENGRIGGDGGYFVVKGFSGLSKLTYTAEITSKDSAPYSNLKAIVGFAFAAHASLPLVIEVNLEPTAFAGGGTFQTSYTTSDISLSATYTGSDGKDVTLGPQVYDDEKRYWYDFSLVLPIKSYHDLTYDTTANGLSARNISKNNLYAAFNFGLPRDTKRARFQPIPVLLYGLPISGQPLKHHLFAASVGLNYVNFFAGVGLDQKNFYHDFTKPLTGSNVFQVWRTHLTYGLNFDPQAIIKSLNGKK